MGHHAMDIQFWEHVKKYVTFWLVDLQDLVVTLFQELELAQDWAIYEAIYWLFKLG